LERDGSPERLGSIDAKGSLPAFGGNSRRSCGAAASPAAGRTQLLLSKQSRAAAIGGRTPRVRRRPSSLP
jgi:hypothetical protein